jgi:hypothetical protein
MVNKQSFTPDEWAKITKGIMLAGVAVTAAAACRGHDRRRGNRCGA